MFVTNWISPTKIQKISEITNFFRHYFLSRTEVYLGKKLFSSKLVNSFRVGYNFRSLANSHTTIPAVTLTLSECLVPN